MPTLDEHPASSIIKMLNVGDSGAGKTGQLVSLVEEGYKLWVLDYDKGLDIIVNILRAKGKSHLLKNVTYETIAEKITFVKGKAFISKPPVAFRAAGNTLEQWNANSFTSNDIIVLDTLNTFSQSAFNDMLFIAGRLNLPGDAGLPRIQDYGMMATAVLTFIDALTSVSQSKLDSEGNKTTIPGLDCHVIINTHVKYLSPEDEALLASRDKQLEFSRAIGVPEAKGQEISRNIAKYFNTLVHSANTGNGPVKKREILTLNTGVLGTKSSNPVTVKDRYPIETGLADLFADILGHRGPLHPTTTTKGT